MIIGMNAGLYAYESWRNVVSYTSTITPMLSVFLLITMSTVEQIVLVWEVGDQEEV